MSYNLFHGSIHGDKLYIDDDKRLPNPVYLCHLFYEKFDDNFCTVELVRLYCNDDTYHNHLTVLTFVRVPGVKKLPEDIFLKAHPDLQHPRFYPAIHTPFSFSLADTEPSTDRPLSGHRTHDTFYNLRST